MTSLDTALLMSSPLGRFRSPLSWSSCKYGGGYIDVIHGLPIGNDLHFWCFFSRIYTNLVKGIPDFLQVNFANDSWLSYFLLRLQGSPSSPVSGPPNGRRWACLWVRGSGIPKWGFLAGKIISTLWLFNIAMENGP